MKNILFTFVLLFIFFAVCTGQNNINAKNNTLSLELGKVGTIFNVTFDHKIKAKKYGYKLNIGSNLFQYQNVLQVGGGLYYLKGKQNNFIELGIDLSYFQYTELSDDQRGFSFLLINDYTKTVYSNVNIGYRFVGNKSMFRIGISPGVMNTGFVIGGYISYGFKL